MAATTGTANADFRLNSGIPSMMFRSSRVPKRSGWDRNGTKVVRLGCIHDVRTNYPTYPHHSGTLSVATTGTADADFRLNSAISSMIFGSSRVPK